MNIKREFVTSAGHTIRSIKDQQDSIDQQDQRSNYVHTVYPIKKVTTYYSSNWHAIKKEKNSYETRHL